MKKEDFYNMNDDEFNKVFESFNNKMKQFLEEDDFFNRYIAYFIAEEYKQELLPDNSLEIIAKTALNDLTVIHPSMDKVKEHLKSEYNLEVIDEDILKLKEL